jgi:hypothetical protein
MRKISVRTVICAVVVVAVVGVVAWGIVARRGNPETATGPATLHAPQGQVAAGFPKELILDKGVQVSNSYTVSYSSTTNQYTVQWNSPSTAASIYNSYFAYLPTHGWTITNRFTTHPGMLGLYATKTSATSSASVSVTITVQSTGSQASASYAVTENATPAAMAASEPGVTMLPAGHVPPDISKYLDLSKTHPYSGEIRTLTSGGTQSTVSLPTAHLLQNYSIIKEGLVAAGFALTTDVLNGHAFAIYGSVGNGKKLIQVRGAPTSTASNSGTITIMLTENQ